MSEVVKFDWSAVLKPIAEGILKKLLELLAEKGIPVAATGSTCEKLAKCLSSQQDDLVKALAHNIHLCKQFGVDCCGDDECCTE